MRRMQKWNNILRLMFPAALFRQFALIKRVVGPEVPFFFLCLDVKNCLSLREGREKEEREELTENKKEKKPVLIVGRI